MQTSVAVPFLYVTHHPEILHSELIGQYGFSEAYRAGGTSRPYRQMGEE
jgi:hypothetical protein